MPVGNDECFNDASWGPNPNATMDCGFSPTRIVKAAWAGAEEKWPAAYEILSNYQLAVEDALEFFRNVPVVAKKLQTLIDVGLSYIHLGQNATTLSGGEAQRVKLARELSVRLLELLWTRSARRPQNFVEIAVSHDEAAR